MFTILLLKCQVFRRVDYSRMRLIYMGHYINGKFWKTNSIVYAGVVIVRPESPLDLKWVPR